MCRKSDSGHRALRVSSAALGVAAALLLASCSSGESTHSGEHEDGVTIIQPGRPGEAATTVGPDAVPEAASWNHADVAFMQMMIPHHEQALVMSRLAETRASSKQVLSLADRIKAAQGPEIMTMAAWLDARSLEVPESGEGAEFDHGEHGHHAMAGMLTTEQMARLKRARGAEFDRLFLRGMIAHHQGALTMADRATVEGSDLQVSEMAADVSAGQSAEIQRMRELLRRLGA